MIIYLFYPNFNSPYLMCFPSTSMDYADGNEKQKQWRANELCAVLKNNRDEIKNKSSMVLFSRVSATHEKLN